MTLFSQAQGATFFTSFRLRNIELASGIFLLLISFVSCTTTPSEPRTAPVRSVLQLSGIPSSFAEPDYSYYHRSDALLEEVRQLVGRHPDIMTVETLSHKNEDYSADVEVVTVLPYATQGEPERSIRALLDFGQHGREPITCEVALQLLRVLAGEAALPAGVDEVNLTGLLKQMVIKIIPAENMNGKKKVEAGELCERKNGRGVDPNRNWSIDWGVKEPDYDPAEEFPGTGPFSEPEAELLQGLAASFQPHLWVNVHSGMEALFLPYDHLSVTPPDDVARPMLELLQKVNRLHCGDRCVVGSGGGSVGYLAHGTATDYMFDVLHIPLAFTWEIYGDMQADNNDCFRMFNPVSKDVFDEVVSNWTSAFVTVLSDLGATLDKLPSQATSNASLLVSNSSLLRIHNATKDGQLLAVSRDDLPWEETSTSSVKGLAEQVKRQGALDDAYEDNRGFVSALGRAWYALLPLTVFAALSFSVIIRRTCSWLWGKRRSYWRGRAAQRAVLPL